MERRMSYADRWWWWLLRGWLKDFYGGAVTDVGLF